LVDFPDKIRAILCSVEGEMAAPEAAADDANLFYE
jgi:hypothetical protein